MYSIELPQPLQLENGKIIEKPVLSYSTYGQITEAGDNVIWVCHALTANSNVLSWWKGLFGDSKLFNPSNHFIICANSIGSCYGSTGPQSPRLERKPMLDQFPELTIRDIVNSLEQLRCLLGIATIQTLIGPSLGGQLALEWSILRPAIFKKMVLIATNAKHSAYGIAFNESQRLAIKTDNSFGNGNIKGGRNGLITARSIAMLSYRSYVGYLKTQEDEDSVSTNFKASRYQFYQGQKLADRFSAYSYIILSSAMDSHNVGRNRQSVSNALSKVKARTLVVGITSDQLFPINEQKQLAKHIPDAEYQEIQSDFGHDGFLVETAQLEHLLDDFLNNGLKKYKQTVFKSNKIKVEL